jgi:exfoliative toxin A/B
MKKIIVTMPLPISGLMLALAALGNLLGSYSQGARYLLGGISGIILIALILKLVIMPNAYSESLSNSVSSSIMATIPMALMIQSTYIVHLMPSIAYGIWISALALNAALILGFTKKHVLNFNIKNVFPSCFVLYVGIAVGSVTAPAYGMQLLGRIVFWYALAAYAIWLPIVTYRVFKYKEFPNQIKPVMVIYAAPASLLLVGYLNVFQNISTYMVFVLGAWALVMTLFAISKMPRLLKLDFYPSYSAFTFPYVISATSFTSMLNFLSQSGYDVKYLEPVKILMIAWAVAMVLFVLIQYSISIFNEAMPIRAMHDEKRRRQ